MRNGCACLNNRGNVLEVGRRCTDFERSRPCGDLANIPASDKHPISGDASLVLAVRRRAQGGHHCQLRCVLRAVLCARVSTQVTAASTTIIDHTMEKSTLVSHLPQPTVSPLSSPPHTAVVAERAGVCGGEITDRLTERETAAGGWSDCTCKGCRIETGGGAATRAPPKSQAPGLSPSRGMYR